MRKLIWQSPPEIIPKLQKNTIHIWRAPLKLSHPRLDSIKLVLSVDERTRAARFKFSEHQQRFILARGILRYILSYYINQPPEKLIFQYSPHGKPRLVDQTIHFNLSHSGQWVLYAISLQENIGIDIEQIREDIEFKDVAERFFSAYENQLLCRTPEEQKIDKFFRIWTCKEAFIKAIGSGLFFALKDFDVDVTQGLPRLVKINHDLCPVDIMAVENWSFIPLEVAENYKAVVAVQEKVDAIKLWDFV